MRSRLVASLFLVLALAGWSFAQTGPTVASPPADREVVARELLTPGAAPPALRSPLARPLADEETIGANYLGRRDRLIWSVNPAVGELTSATPETLSDAMKQAVALAPNWLKARLTHRFFEINSVVAEELADLIVNPEDERCRDEIAFLSAYAAKNDLEGMRDRAALLTTNARLIYDYDAVLDYVEVVDFDNGGGDYGTTLRYNIVVGGDEQTYDLPADIYYWHVVHPKLDVEGIDHIDPLTGNDETPADGGYFYREYLMNDVDGEASYHTPVYFQGVEEADLQGLAPSASGYFTQNPVHNLEIAYGGDDASLVFVEFAYGAGQVFATTMRLEAAYTAAGSPLLENLLNQGCGDVLLGDGAAIAVIGDVMVPEFQTLLTELGRWANATVISGATLAGFGEAEWTTFNATYAKTIVLPNQPRSVYEAVASAKTQFEAYVSGGYRVLELHLNTAQADDPVGLVFPTGLETSSQFDHSFDDITLYGRPVLADMLAGVDVLWDDTPTGLSGDRDLWDNPNAIAAVGNWIGKNMLDNIQERVDLGADMERALAPVRIAYNHYGNCGELQDLGAAAMRTALIPGGLVSTINEDHVFNEFYFNGAWRPFQVDWSNGGNSIANPGIAYDVDHGGSKQISFVVFWLGDGRIESAADRFSNSITVDFTLTDADGKPVPDANIAIYSEGWMTTFKSQGWWLVTDDNGYAAVKLGDQRNYFISIESGAGSYPAKGKNGKTGMSQIIAVEEATAGATFHFEHQFDAPMVNVSPADVTPENDSYALHVTLGATHRLASATNIFGGLRPYYPMSAMLIDVLLVDDENLDLARENLPFAAAQSWLGVSTLDEKVYPPDDRNWNLMVVRHSAPESDHLLDVQVTAEGEPYTPPADDDASPGDDDDDDDNGGGGDDDDDDSGCGC